LIRYSSLEVGRRLHFFPHDADVGMLPTGHQHGREPPNFFAGSKNETLCCR
jgi:hypothetical protein